MLLLLINYNLSVIYNNFVSTGSKPLNCLKCRDNEEEPCKECGCYLCAQKNDPDKVNITVYFYYMLLNLLILIIILII